MTYLLFIMLCNVSYEGVVLTEDELMPKIRITAEAEAAVRRAAIYDFVGNEANADGTYDIQLQTETLDRLKSARCEGETLSDTIIRVCTVEKPLN